jgi:anaerobic glycerol-3-phosphate dehydrogenase
LTYLDAGDDGEGVRPSGAKGQQKEASNLAANDDVPSNKSMKRTSERTTVDAARRLENEKKLKRLQERMALGRTAAAVDDGGIGGLAAFKAQKAAADRLCTTQSLPTLPPGVKIRDDIMTKTKAFLTVMPDLS